MSTASKKIQDAYGALPKGWRLDKLKFYADIRNSNVDKVVVADEEPIRLCNYTDVYYNDRITADLEFMPGSATQAEINKFRLRRGQVIITKDSEGWEDIGIPALVAADLADVVCGYHLSIMEPTAQLDGAFLAWLCRSQPLNDQFKTAANGVTRFGLGQYPMKNAFIALPPLDTQKGIATFLDEKTEQIDGMIAQKWALLERLAEKRQAVITQAVTMGLNAAVRMKESGIDWIGQIPSHWEVLPLRRLADRVTTGRTPASSAGDYFAEGDVPWFTPGDFKGLVLEEADKALTLDAFAGGHAVLYPAKSILLVGIGATLGKVGLSVVQCSSNQQINAITANAENDPLFLTYFLHGFRAEVRMSASGNTLPILNQDKTKSIVVTRPPLDEQVEIGNLLASRDREFARVEQQIIRSIELLGENRSALITAAVTGQIADLQ